MFTFLLVSFGYFFFYNKKATLSVDGIWKVKTQAAGTTVISFQGTLVLWEDLCFTGAGDGLFIFHLHRQAVATMRIIDFRNLDNPLSHFQTAEWILIRMGRSSPGRLLMGYVFYFLYTLPQKEVKHSSHN